MREIKKNNVVYAIVHYPETESNLKNRSLWFGADTEALQVQKMAYDSGKVFFTHKHKLRPRMNNYTQECFIILEGRLKADIYDDNKNLIESLNLTKGSILICYRGWHGFMVMEDGTIAIEIKNGPYTTKEEDKEF